MPGVIDPETINVDELPGVWSPVQWELNEEERMQELDSQAIASLLFGVDVPEAILRLLLTEYQIERAFDPPANYDPDQQGEWDESLLTFQFNRPIRLVKSERKQDSLHVEYYLADLGYWALEFEPDNVRIYRI
jgi:hypothetical protein